jgi:hypothetical protein
MFMSAATPPTTTHPDSDPAGTGNGSRVGRLLDLVRKLIDYGKELATSLQQRGLAAHLPVNPFGTSDIALILARITRGLHRADALEARLVRRAATLDAQPRPPTPSSRPSPRRAKPAVPCAGDAGPSLAHLSTVEQIAAGLDPVVAAKVRRQPIGAVIADICRDLGILPSHPLWPELRQLIIKHGGSLANLLKDTLDRVLPLSAPGELAAAATTSAGLLPPSPAPASTGPP